MIILVLSFSNFCYGQSTVQQTTTYTVDDGLSANNVNKLYFDRTGYLWVGTINGLNHFDGHTFTQIPQGDKAGQILGCKVMFIFALNENELILGTDLGISTININTFATKNIYINIPDGKSKKVNFVVEMIPSIDGGFWILTLNEIVYINKKLEVLSKKELPLDANSSYTHLSSPRMVALKSGNLLFMNIQNINRKVENSIYEFDKKSNILKERKFSFMKSTMKFSGLTRLDDQNILFIEDTADNIRTYVWNEVTEAHKNLPFFAKSSPTFYNLVFPYNAKGMAISIIGDKYLYVLNDDYNSWVKENKVHNASNFLYIKEKIISPNGSTYWVGDLGFIHTTNKILNKNETLYRSTESIVNWNNVTSSFKLNDSIRWYVEQEKQIIIFNTKNGQWKLIPQEIILNETGIFMKEACAMTKDEILFNTNKGLRIYNLRSKTLSILTGYRNKPSAFDKLDFQHFVSKNGAIWIKFSIENRLYLLDTMAKEINIYKNPMIEGIYYTDISEDNKGNLFFVGPGAKGILKFNASDHNFSKILPNQKDHPNFANVTDLACDSNDNLWLFTNGYGIFCLSKDSFKEIAHFSTENGLSNNYIVEKLVDKNGKFLIKTINRYHLIDPDTKILTNLSLKNAPKSGIGFNWLDPEKSFLYINRNGNDEVIHVDSLAAKRPIANIDVFRAEWQGHFLKIPKEKKISIDQKYNSLIIYFRSINFRNGSENKYYYRLLPHQPQWVEIINTNKIYLNHISKGQNTLDIKLCYNNGQCFEQECLSVYVRPFLWQRWWFWTILILGIMGILFKYLYAEYEKKKIKLEKTEAEMQLLQSRMNPHFIYNALNSINRYILVSDKLNASEYLSKFAKLMRFALDNSNKTMISIDKELGSLRIYLELESLRLQHKIDIQIYIDPTLVTGKDVIPPMMIQPFVENAIWHGLMPKAVNCVLNIKFNKFGNDLQIIIADNGVGRHRLNKENEPKLKSSEGIKMSQKRMEALSTLLGSKGKITIEDLVDDSGLVAGTKVVIYFVNILKH